MRLIDANVVVYAIGQPHAYRESCRRVIALAYRGGIEANVDVELLQEILHYYHRRRATDVGLGVVASLLRRFASPFPMAHDTVRLARQILGQYRHLQARDAFHAAVVVEHGLEGIISADRGFDRISGVKRFDPNEFV